MAKKSKKRRAWTAHRNSRIEVVGKKEDCRGENCQEVEKDGRRDAPEGVQHRALARFPFLIFLSNAYTDRRRRPARAGRDRCCARFARASAHGRLKRRGAEIPAKFRNDVRPGRVFATPWRVPPGPDRIRGLNQSLISAVNYAKMKPNDDRQLLGQMVL